jgi:hypothetical protein
MAAPYISDGIGMAQFFFILAGVPLILFSGFLAFLLYRCISVLRTRAQRVGIALFIAIASFGSVTFLSGTDFPVHLATGLLSLLWFPTGVVLPALLIPERYAKDHLPAVVAFTGMLAYIFGEIVMKAGDALGLRETGILLIYPAPPVPYAMMQLPLIFHTVLEFCIVAGFAIVLLSLMLWYQRRWQKTPVSRDDVLAIGAATIFCWMAVLYHIIDPEELLQTVIFLAAGILLPLVFLYTHATER